MKKNTLTVLAALLGLILIFIMFAPDHRIYAAKAMARRVVRHNGQICMDLFARALKVPQSAELMQWERRDSSISITYTAENSFGARVSGDGKCPLDDDGDVNIPRAELWVLRKQLKLPYE